MSYILTFNFYIHINYGTLIKVGKSMCQVSQGSFHADQP